MTWQIAVMQPQFAHETLFRRVMPHIRKSGSVQEHTRSSFLSRFGVKSRKGNLNFAFSIPCIIIQLLQSEPTNVHSFIKFTIKSHIEEFPAALQHAEFFIQFVFPDDGTIWPETSRSWCVVILLCVRSLAHIVTTEISVFVSGQVTGPMSLYRRGYRPKFTLRILSLLVFKGVESTLLLEVTEHHF